MKLDCSEIDFYCSWSSPIIRKPNYKMVPIKYNIENALFLNIKLKDSTHFHSKTIFPTQYNSNHLLLVLNGSVLSTRIAR